jgi:hypothetical protein
MKWKFETSISLRSQTGLQLWRTYIIVGNNGVWEYKRENVKTSWKENLNQYKWKQHKLHLHEECSKVVVQWKQAKLKWLQEPSQINTSNQNNSSVKLVGISWTKENISKVKLISLKQTKEEYKRYKQKHKWIYQRLPV